MRENEQDILSHQSEEVKNIIKEKMNIYTNVLSG